MATRRVLTVLLSLACSLAVVPRVAAAEVSPPQGIRGTAEAPVRDATGHVDATATVARLTQLHANTYDYLVEAPTDWGDLPAFLQAAQPAGIDVFAYLVPPTECPSSAGSPQSCDLYLPDHGDYVRWGADIGALAAAHPNLVAWTIDDMDHDLGLYTPAYVDRMTAAATALAPNLRFYLQFYQPSVTQSLVDGYGPSVAGVIVPFRDGTIRDTVWTGTMQSHIDSLTAILNASGKRLIAMVYGSTLSSTMLPPDTDYVRTMTARALADTATGQIDGVIVWKLALNPVGSPAFLSTNLARTGDGVLDLTVDSDTKTAAGDYAQAATTVTLDAGSHSCLMALYRHDDRGTDAPAGYHEKRAYVGGTLVWHADVAAEGADWYSSSWLDITPHLSSGSAILALRLTELAGVSNYEVRVDFDDLRFQGCSIPNPTFETDSGWTLSRAGSGRVLPALYQYSPTYSTDTFDAVSALYAS